MSKNLSIYICSSLFFKALTVVFRHMSEVEKLKHFVKYGIPIKLMALLSEMVFTSNILLCYPTILWAVKLLMQ